MPKRMVSRIEDFSIPILWRDFISELNDYGFKMSNTKRGSKRIFVCGNVQFIAHEPHAGEKTVDKKSREHAVRAIKRLEGEET